MRFTQVRLNAFFSLLFVISLFAISPDSSYAQGKIMLSDANGSDEVLVHFSMDIENIVVFQGKIVWDTSILRLKEVTPEVWPCCMGNNVVNNNSNLILAWDDATLSGQDFHEDEALLTLHFEVLEQAQTLVYFTENNEGPIHKIEVFDPSLTPLSPKLIPAVINGTAEKVIIDLFKDNDMDCQSDESIPLKKLYLQNGEYPLVSITNSEGQAEFITFPDTYLLTLESIQRHHSICNGDPDSLQVVAGTNTHKKFIISPDFLCPKNNIYAYTNEEYDDFMNGHINFQNLGTVISENTRIELQIDDNMQLISSDPAFDEQIGNIYIYNWGDLEVFERDAIHFVTEYNSDIPLEEIEDFTFIVEIDPDTLCQDGLTNYSFDYLVVDNSHYVPDSTDNDLFWASMAADPPGIGPNNLISPSQNLTYTITYRNLGNSSIDFLTIIDTLPGSLDPTSIEIIDFDHTYYPNILEDSILYIELPNLQLPDSSSTLGNDYMGSISFRVNQSTTIEDNTKITNRAWINFDDDFVHASNIVSHTSTLDPITSITNQNKINIEIFPNPFNDHLTIKQNSNSPASIKLFNALGELVYSDYITGKQTEVQVPNMDAGLYYYTIRREGKQITSGKIVKQ